MKITRTNAGNPDFNNLVKDLDAYLKITDEDEHDFYNQFNLIDSLQEVVVIYISNSIGASPVAIGCGAMKKMDSTSVELKRMYVVPQYRGKGVAQKILKELEIWAVELGYKKSVLETGKRQVEAVKFYHNCGYTVIENYGQYKGMTNSICFEKIV
jgi:putative acetyltransferase